MKPVSRDGYKFRTDICIPCYQTGRNKTLTPAGFMDMAQEIAYWAAEELGFGYSTLHIHHTAWVLSRMHVHFADTPRWTDTVHLYTWHKGSGGLFYLRDFDMQGENGEHLVTATSSWVVMNEETRRLVRPEEMEHLLSVDGPVDDAIAEPAPKLQEPKGMEMEPAGEHTVSYSDIDLIGHTNNVRYMVWAMDHIPKDEVFAQVKDVYINFNKETTLGQTISIFRLKTDNSWWIEGRFEGKSCFTVRIDF